jgi:hypothetical protein
LVQGEIDKGFLLVHRSYEEGQLSEIRAPTPSLKLVTLNFADTRQFFGALVRDWADYLGAFLPGYSAASGRRITLDHWRTALVGSPRRHEAAFSLTHTIARLYALKGVSAYVAEASYTSQHQLNLLFDLTLAIDDIVFSTLQPTPLRRPHFPQLLGTLTSAAGLGLREGDLTGFINPMMTTQSDFDNLITALVSRSVQFPRKPVSLELESDIAIAYAVRNRGAHNVVASSAILSHFDATLQSLMNVLFLSVDVLC